MLMLSIASSVTMLISFASTRWAMESIRREAASGVERCLDALKFDPSELEQTEERLFEIRGLARKHNVLPDELAEFADRMRARLAALDVLEDALPVAQDHEQLQTLRAWLLFELDRDVQAVTAIGDVLERWPRSTSARPL